MKQLKVKKLHSDAIIPKYQTKGASGFDFHALEGLMFSPGETKLVKTGLSMAIPKGFELQIRPRSGMSLNTYFRIANSPGTVDSDYRGEICIIVTNTHKGSPGGNGGYSGGQPNYHGGGKGAFVDPRLQGGPGGGNVGVMTVIVQGFDGDSGYCGIAKGERIAQGVIVPVLQPKIVEVKKLSKTKRGSGGFGSTNKKEKI